MGEIADMMLDGTLCQCCGVYIGSDYDFPTHCSDCKPVNKKRKPVKMAKEQCPECGKYVAWAGMQQHTKAKHGG